MVKGLIGGGTDYRHQSFVDILNDLVEERDQTIEFLDAIKVNIEKLIDNSYWTNHVPYDFKMMVEYAQKHYDTAIAEFNDIIKELSIEVKENHINRLKRISSVASEINGDIGRIWHQQYGQKDYGNSDFRIVELIYADIRGIAVSLLDISNMAMRLRDFIGKQGQQMKNNNPWISGSFYLFVCVVVIAGIAVISKFVHWSLIPIILIGGILLIFLIGIFQLKNDDRISDKSFVSLIKETFKRLPLLTKFGNNENTHRDRDVM